jgi:hypothetical protein
MLFEIYAINLYARMLRNVFGNYFKIYIYIKKHKLELVSSVLLSMNLCGLHLKCRNMLGQ